MPATFRRAAALALLLTVTWPQAAPALGTPPPARAWVDSIAARYTNLATYHFQGVSHVTMAPDSGGAPMSSETPFVFAARWPSRLRTAIMNPNQPVLLVADGESLAVFVPTMGQYVVQAAPRLAAGHPATGEFASALQPLAGLGRLATGVVSARVLGPDTVLTAAGPVSCLKLELEYAPDSTRRGSTMLPRVLWVDPARDLVLRDEIALRIAQPGQPALTNRQSMRFVIAEADGGPDSLYRIEPLAGLARVKRLGPPEPPPPAIVGKPAKDFTLPRLGSATKVRLSALRGKVVVLDFWATWCGPCRRWMPIVAKLEQELRGRDVRFFAVNERDPADKVREFLKTTGVTVPVLLDAEGSVGLDYDARSIPLTVIVGRDGKVVDALVGLHPEEELRDALRNAGVKGL